MSETKAEYTADGNQPAVQPEPVQSEGYFVCPGCGKILGMKIREGKAIFLHVYIHPPLFCHNLERLKVNARILSGDVWCPCCCQWREWNAAVERPWEAPIC
jgi:hypothetical protein